MAGGSLMCEITTCTFSISIRIVRLGSLVMVQKRCLMERFHGFTGKKFLGGATLDTGGRQTRRRSRIYSPTIHKLTLLTSPILPLSRRASFDNDTRERAARILACAWE